MPRLLFSKTGDAVWISHLDLMRLFQRAFKRAGLPLKHSQGFTPRPMVSIALPLSVGVESLCELLDFDLDGERIPPEEICARLNKTLVSGVKALAVYEAGRKLKELSLLQCTVTLEYDAGVTEELVTAGRELFARDSICVMKKGKNGPTEQDIAPMIRSLAIVQADENCLELRAVVCAQNPSLNPMLLAAAVERYLPQWKPDFARCRREELLDAKEEKFR